jgi:hypothetical protein
VSVVSDEVLMAYADGALEPAEREAVEAIIERRPECRQKVEKYRATLAPLQNLFRESIGIDHLAPLIERIRRGELEPARAPVRAAEVRQLPQSHTLRSRRPVFRPSYPTAIAASVALLIAAAVGWLLLPGSVTSGPAAGLIQVSDGSLRAQGALQDLLEHTARGVPRHAEMAGKAWELEASFTFRAADQQPCRRYELRSAARDHFAGYACRSTQGEWMIRGHAKLDPPAANAPGGFAPASGSAGNAADLALEAAIRAAGGGRVYQDAEEKALIASGWAR